MKKTINITLSSTLFHIEEDAYLKLSEYLDSVKKHFSFYEDGEEIILDIENRVAEKFLENNNKDRIVNLENVEDLISTMGDFKDTGNTTEESAPASHENYIKRKLFRDPDDKIIAGVSSGLAAFFGIDTTLVRLFFVFIVLLGGSGIIIYVVLWLVVPEAKTSTDKLQMRGERITLESVRDLAEEKLSELKQNKNPKKKFRLILEAPFKFFERVFRNSGSILGRIVGMVLTVVVGLVILATLTATTFLIFNIYSPLVDFPFIWSIEPVILYAFVFLVFLMIFIPLVFILLLGIKLLTQSKVFRISTSMVLISLWVMAFIIAGAIFAQVIPEYLIENNLTIKIKDPLKTNFQGEYPPIEVNGQTIIFHPQ